MFYLCPKHGGQPLMEISPDLRMLGEEGPLDFVRIFYHFDENDIRDCFRIVTVSKDFAAAHGLQAGHYAVSDNYEFPAGFEKLLTGKCMKCFEEEYNGRFVDLEWTPNNS